MNSEKLFRHLDIMAGILIGFTLLAGTLWLIAMRLQQINATLQQIHGGG